MLMPEKLPSRLRLRLLRPFSHPLPPPPSQRPCRRCLLSTAGPARWPQKIPLGEYYESILRTAQRTQRARDAPRPLVVDVPLSDPRAADEKTRTPLDTTSSFDTSPPAPPPTSTTTTGTAAATATATEAATPTMTTTTTAEEKARIVFGSRLLGPAEQEDRAAAKRAQSTLVAGVLVPPRPEEPDNCCMSGCVNCVWDRYGEDLEEWTARKTEAEAEAEEEMLRATSVGDAGKRQKEEEEDEKKKTEKKQRVTKEMLEEEAYSDVPMAIREFIKLEKRLRDKHKQEGAAGG